MKQIFFDVETIKMFDEVGGYFPERLGVSFCGVIERDGFPEEGNVVEVRHELFEKDLGRINVLFQQADVIVGFNSLGFDVPALKAHYIGDLTKLPHLDLMDVIKQSVGHRISLDAVAQQTLGTSKSGNGLDAITYYQTGQLDKLASYCMKDVEITRDLYDFGRRNGIVKFLNRWNNPIEAAVNFSAPEAANAGLQLSLV